MKQMNKNNFKKIILTGKTAGDIDRINLRRIIFKGALKFQAEEIKNNQAFHKNMEWESVEKYLAKHRPNFKNINIIRGEAEKSHDRQKDYIISDGAPCPPLIQLGVMDEDGKVFKSKMDKFIQINSFLEILRDATRHIKSEKMTACPSSPRRRGSSDKIYIADFCSGKSYLTFVIEYFFTNILKRPVHIVGIDSKTDVIKKCQDIACDNIELIAGDIRDFNPTHKIDIALSLHACDIATDIVLKKSVELGATAILAAPCCHQELHPKIKSPELDFILKYGTLRERFASILTDAIRAEWLSEQGYKVDILEFVDFANTPKNVLIRAVYNGKKTGAKIIKNTADKFGAAPATLIK